MTITKKADSQMWWIIIGAVIALVVLVVLLLIFTDKIKLLKDDLSDCQSKGGICVESCTSGTTSKSFTCPDKKICCFTQSG